MKVIRFIGLIVIGLIVNAFAALVLVQYWQWFVMTSFANVPELNFLQALAIMTVGSIFWAKDTEGKEPEVLIVMGIVKIILYFITGYLIYLTFYTGLFS